MAEMYSGSSPWADTDIVNDQYLGFFRIRPIPASDTDFLYTIETQYTFRPDLLAHDLYGNHNLWWVFAQRNMDVIKDPIYDFVAGQQIFIPKGSNLKNQLGLR